MAFPDELQERESVGAEGDPAPAPSLRKIVRAALARCEQRRCQLPGLPFEDPRWLMALELLLAAEEGRALTVTNLTVAAQVPFSTALRHINAMVSEGLLERVAHPTDGRVAYLSLSSALAADLTAFLLAGGGAGATIAALGDRTASGAAESPFLSEWRCIERANESYVSTLLTRGDVAISLVVRRPAGPAADDRAASAPIRQRLLQTATDESAAEPATLTELAIQL